jgi:uncharacterized protein (TIGR02145 family)
MKTLIVLFGMIILFSCNKNKDLINTDTFTDNRDNQVYKTKSYGSQTWMLENLSYNSPNSRYYNNDTLNKKYGRLYSFQESQSICPDNWELPGKEDWEEFKNYLGGDSLGNDLKTDSLWNDKYFKGKNIYEFNALPSGVGQIQGDIELNNQTFWWTSTEENENSAYSPGLQYYNYRFDIRATDKNYYYSVRCIKK